jgi:hypothetical protein
MEIHTNGNQRCSIYSKPLVKKDSKSHQNRTNLSVTLNRELMGEVCVIGAPMAVGPRPIFQKQTRHSEKISGRVPLQFTWWHHR